MRTFQSKLIFLVFCVVALSQLGSMCKERTWQQNTRATLLGSQTVIDTGLITWKNYYTASSNKVLDDFQSDKIDQVEMDKRLATLNNQNQEVIKGYQKVQDSQNTAVSLFFLIESGAVSLKDKRIELDHAIQDLMRVVTEFNKLLVDFGVIK